MGSFVCCPCLLFCGGHRVEENSWDKAERLPRVSRLHYIQRAQVEKATAAININNTMAYPSIKLAPGARGFQGVPVVQYDTRDELRHTSSNLHDEYILGKIKQCININTRSLHQRLLLWL